MPKKHGGEVMCKQNNLIGERFGNLTVLEKAEGLQNRYYTWLCRCDCGNEIIVNTKNLTSHTTTHCGCRTKELVNAHIQPKDRTGKLYGALTALRMTGKSDKGEFLWECECKCGKHITVPAKQLHDHKAKDCGCGAGDKRYKDIAGSRSGMLTALYPTEKRDGKGSVIWVCRCDCGNEAEISESNFMFGGYVSCGCVRAQMWQEFTFSDCLTFVDGTCVEIIAKRKKRNDNTSGFRGVCRIKENSYRSYIGLQRKKYDLGRYNTFEEAVAVRSAVERQLHDGFLSCWKLWHDRAVSDEEWAKDNPFFFSVRKERRTFYICSAVTQPSKFVF